jgi:hypothetical protein
MSTKSMDQEVAFILGKMFECVGAEYTADAVREPDWYLKHTWTNEQEVAFIEWLTNHLRRRHAHYTKRRAYREAHEIVLHIGWKQAE